MADTLLIYAGKEDTMPVLPYRQLGYCYDSKKLYIGGSSEDGNVLIGSVVWGEEINTLKEDMVGKLTANKVVSIAEIASDADIAAVITTFNSLIGSLKTAGIMTT